MKELALEAPPEETNEENIEKAPEEESGMEHKFQETELSDTNESITTNQEVLEREKLDQEALEETREKLKTLGEQSPEDQLEFIENLSEEEKHHLEIDPESEDVIEAVKAEHQFADKLFEYMEALDKETLKYVVENGILPNGDMIIIDNRQITITEAKGFAEAYAKEQSPAEIVKKVVKESLKKAVKAVVLTVKTAVKLVGKVVIGTAKAVWSALFGRS